MARAMFWQLGGCSDAEVLARLEGLVASTRQVTAELVAHLGEVEERRLHLTAAFGSMFQYCTMHLGLSEDEACRRIEVARLARRFPILFPALARGELSLSVAARLKPYLSEENQGDLVQRLSGKSVRQADECLAALFPRPDVASSVRKMPGPGSRAIVCETALPLPENPLSRSQNGCQPVMAAASSATMRTAVACPVEETSSRDVNEKTLAAVNPVETDAASAVTSQVDANAANEVRFSTPVVLSPQRGTRGRLEPLSAERYRVQFTAGLALKEKLELARDLMRHANPTGDFAPIVERALDLLIEQLMQRRFGKRRRAPHDCEPVSATVPPAREGSLTEAADERGTIPASARVDPGRIDLPMPAQGSGSRRQRTGTKSAEGNASPVPAMNPQSAGGGASAAPTTGQLVREIRSSRVPPTSAMASADSGASRNCRPRHDHPLQPAAASKHLEAERITNATRRAVAARDGLQCSWVDDHGRRCGSRTWLELDHQQPRGKGGSSEAHNVRIFCRAHNQFEAEQAYGRKHMKRAVRRARRCEPTPPLKVRDSRHPHWPTHTSSPSRPGRVIADPG